MLNTSAGVLSSSVSVARDQWTQTGPQFSTYIADISKGILIILVAGLGCGMLLSLVRGRARGRGAGGAGSAALQTGHDPSCNVGGRTCAAVSKVNML
jgi:hypothetical protein